MFNYYFIETRDMDPAIMFDRKEIKALYVFPFLIWSYIYFFERTMENAFILLLVFFVTSLFYILMYHIVRDVVSKTRNQSKAVAMVFNRSSFMFVAFLMLVTLFASLFAMFSRDYHQTDLIAFNLLIMPSALFLFGVLCTVSDFMLGLESYKAMEQITDHYLHGKPK